MNELNTNDQNFNIKFKDLTRPQKIGLIALTIFTVTFIGLLCYLADKAGPKVTRQVALAFLLLFVVFFAIDFALLVIPSDKQKAAAIIKYNSFLYEAGFTVQEPVYKKKTCEIIFTDGSDLSITFVLLRRKIKYIYFQTNK